MNASLIIIGNEITRGLVQDSHVKRIGSLLDGIGVRLECVFIINDSGSIRDYITFASHDCDIIITTGGLGPTDDDRTRDEISNAVSRPLMETDQARQNVEKRLGCGSFGPSNMRQALIPEGFEVIVNENGTAPGFYGEVAGKLYISLPGPPRECEPMLAQTRRIICDFSGMPQSGCAAFSLFLVPEARFNDLSNKVLTQIGCADKLEIGTCFKDYKIDVFVYYRDARAKDAYVSAIKAVLHEEMPIKCFFDGDVDVFQDFRNLIVSKRLTVSTAESITAGYISKLITDMPGSSSYFLSGIVCYSNEIKMMELGVGSDTIDSHTEVSVECADEMSAGCAAKFGSDIAIAVTGYAGPDGKDVGKVCVSIAYDKGRSRKTIEFRFAGRREHIRKRTAIASLLMACSVLRDKCV